MIDCEKRTYELTGTTPLLGSSPASPDIRTQYIASKAPAPADIEEEEERYVPEIDDKGLTVFLRDPKSGALMFLDYQIRGFFKAAIRNLNKQNGIKQSRAKVDRYLFVGPRTIKIMKDGEPVLEEDEILERPLRGMTMKGERIALAGSEEIYDPWTIRIELTLIPNEGTKTSRALTWKDVEDALDFGEYMGLGQFYNGGYGRFTWKRVEGES